MQCRAGCSKAQAGTSAHWSPNAPHAGGLQGPERTVSAAESQFLGGLIRSPGGGRGGGGGRGRGGGEGEEGEEETNAFFFSTFLSLSHIKSFFLQAQN